MKKTLSRIFLLVLCLALVGCSKGANPEAAQALSFAASVDYNTLSELNGKQVSITGYMATLSPISGEYIYLMNLPYQSCPFCVPNTTQLANTMAVYAKNGKTFTYTDQAIRVTGKMELGDYTDDYGYVYNYRIVDATYEIVDLSSLSGDYSLWYSIAEDGIVADINSMFDYLYFLCQWTEYQSTYEDENGQTVSYYLYPGDVENYLSDDGPNGYAAYRADGYFDTLISRLRAISDTELEDLVEILTDSQTVEQYALEELESQNYTYDETEDKYALNHSEDLYNQFYEVYNRFSEWLTKWQL